MDFLITNRKNNFWSNRLRWILLVVGVFGLCGGVAIAYWRQTHVDVSPASMLMILILLPSVIVGSVYGVYRLRKSLKERREAEQEEPKDGSGEAILAEGPAAPWLHVYATAVQTQLGDHADNIILALQQCRTAECDPELFSANGSRLLSRRIDLTMINECSDQDVDVVNAHSLSDRALRIEVLTQNLYAQLDQTLAAIAEGMTETHLWQLPAESRQAILHPAWQGKTIEAPQQSVAVEINEWPKTIKILYLLPHHIDEDAQHYLQQTAYAQLLRYGFQAEQVQWINHITHMPDETLQQIGNVLTEQLKPQSSILLVLGVDSHLDQDLVDELQQDNAQLIPAEASFSILLSSETTRVSSLPVLARLTAPILTKRQKPISVGGQLGADALTTGFDELRRIYKLQENALVPDSGILISDIHPAQSANLRELSLFLRPFDLPAESLIYAGSLLESTNLMTSGVALAIALQQTESAKHHIPIICSAGDTVRGLWLAAPDSQNFSDVEPLVESESLKAVFEHA